VMAREVVEDPHGCLTSEEGVGSVMVVAVRPAVKSLSDLPVVAAGLIAYRAAARMHRHRA